MFGQSIASLSNVFLWTAAPLLSEVWFPPRERATATAIGGAIAPQVHTHTHTHYHMLYYNIIIILTLQSGILLGLGLTPFIVHSDEALQFSVCGNATTQSFATPEETKEWSDFVFSRLLYFNIAVAAIGFFAFLITVLGK